MHFFDVFNVKINNIQSMIFTKEPVIRTKAIFFSMQVSTISLAVSQVRSGK
jgi:hypothetical protein